MAAAKRLGNPMTRDEIVGAIKLLDEGRLSQSKRDALVVALKDAFPRSSVSGLSYHHEPELSADQIADEVLRREAEWRTRNLLADLDGGA